MIFDVYTCAVIKQQLTLGGCAILGNLVQRCFALLIAGVRICTGFQQQFHYFWILDCREQRCLAVFVWSVDVCALLDKYSSNIGMTLHQC